MKMGSLRDALPLALGTGAVAALIFGLIVVFARPRDLVVTPWHSDSLGITCLVQRGEIKACLWDVERPAR